jgi:16S rRNA (guanine527-N7)-methyltransferase
VAALEEAQAEGFLGPEPIGKQLDHSVEFAACADLFLRAHAVDGRPRQAFDPKSVEGVRFLDLGTGGGLPGLVLLALWQSSSAVLLDANERRTAFLEKAVSRLGWDSRVQVLRDRAENAGRAVGLRGSLGLVVARAFGPPPVVAECASPFLVVGGLLVVSEPPPLAGRQGASEPVLADRWPAGPLLRLGLEPVTTWRENFGFTVLRQTAPCPETYPRRVGVPSKRPLY